MVGRAMVAMTEVAKVFKHITFTAEATVAKEFIHVDCDNVRCIGGIQLGARPGSFLRTPLRYIHWIHIDIVECRNLVRKGGSEGGG